MKKSMLMRGLFVALLLASAGAGAKAQYPAADFEPQILFQNADLIAQHSARPIEIKASPIISAAKPPADAAEAIPVKSLAPQEELLMQDYAVILVLLILGGIIFWSIKRPGKAQGGRASGTTGVARYISNLSSSASVKETGVTKYMKKQGLSG